MEGFGPETLAWLATRPQWDPRVRLASPAERPAVLRGLRQQRLQAQADAATAHPAARANATLIGDDPFDGLAGRISQVNGACRGGMAKAMDISLVRLNPDLLRHLAGQENADGDAGDLLDGVPEWFIGPLLKDLVMHEVGHILGLRHNFKASSAYGMDVINSAGHKGRPITGSVMDYTPVNLEFDEQRAQGEFAMVTLGSYDYWAIEYGYTSGDPKVVLQRVADPTLAYATDEDTWGPDPLARTFDLGADSLDFAESEMILVHRMRGQILDKMVKDGESWSKAREGYEMLLSTHGSALGVAASWVGGSFVHRDHKGDPGGRDPVEPISAEQQRRALTFVIENAFEDEAFGIDGALLRKMTVEKWWDDGGFWFIFDDQTWPVHDRILGVQASVMTQLLNPTTLNRVYDNEFRADADEDALTLPELLISVTDAIFEELENSPERNFTNRDPMISSLRRNLQRECLDRLIDLSLPNDMLGAAAKPISNLSVYKLRELQRVIEKTLNRGGARLDAYTLAHLSEAQVRIGKALDAQYIYNAGDVGGGGSLPFIFLQPDSGGDGD
jgi:hypothetical protein